MRTAASNKMDAVELVRQEIPTSDAPLPYNPQTGFATDFLNQYNELTMTLELIPDMPDLFEDFADWTPKSYKEHFESSGFQYKAMIIEAYEQAKPAHKAQFDACVAELDNTALKAIDEIGCAIENSADAAELTDLSQSALSATRAYMGTLSQIIHGNMTTADQEEVDALLAEGDEPNSQDAIDALFD